jgi:hypothetical protein
MGLRSPVYSDAAVRDVRLAETATATSSRQEQFTSGFVPHNPTLVSNEEPHYVRKEERINCKAQYNDARPERGRHGLSDRT